MVWPDFTADLRIMFMSCGLDFPATSVCLTENVTTINRDGTGLAVPTNYCGCETEPGALHPVPSPDGSRFAVMEYGTVEDQTQSFLMVFEAADPRGLGVIAWTGPVSERAEKPDWQRLPG